MPIIDVVGDRVVASTGFDHISACATIDGVVCTTRFDDINVCERIGVRHGIGVGGGHVFDPRVVRELERDGDGTTTYGEGSGINVIGRTIVNTSTPRASTTTTFQENAIARIIGIQGQGVAHIAHGIQALWADHHQVCAAIGQVDGFQTAQCGMQGRRVWTTRLRQVQQVATRTDAQGIHAFAATDQGIFRVINDGVITATTVDDVSTATAVNGLIDAGIGVAHNVFGAYATNQRQMRTVSHNLVNLGDLQAQQHSNRCTVICEIGVLVVGNAQHLFGAA